MVDWDHFPAGGVAFNAHLGIAKNMLACHKNIAYVAV
jgi:hypothetical protein